LSDQDQIAAKALPSFDLEQVRAEDALNDYKFDKPWRFGYMHSVDFGFEDGQWTTLKNGDRIWRLAVESKDALSMNFIFDEFSIPQGSSVYLYNDDRSDLLGAYTSIQNQESGILGTWIVKGEKVWIEYFEPANVSGQGQLHIAKATHGYRNADTFQAAKGLNDSGNCNLDVDCSIGSDWEDNKNHNKRSVGILLSGGQGFCTGALINNTNNDGTPFFLTANHCYSNPNAWSFRFGWISPNPVCAANTNSTNGPTTQTISGATLKARSTNADFCLVEINNDIPTEWNRVFAGWDRSDIVPPFTVGIHHPSGDIMKICRDDDSPSKEANAGAQTWEILGGSGQGWELGVTEPGSSGSPLFDDQGRIIGQLYGGAAACSGTNDNNAFDYYGRLGVAWDTGSSAQTRLEDWLDPQGSNPVVLNSFPALEILDLDAAVSVDIPEVSCGETIISPTISLTNFGLNDITTAVITWQIDNGTISTINFNGALSQNQTESFVLDPIDLTEGDYTFNVILVSVNGTEDQNESNNNIATDFSVGGSSDQYATLQVVLELLTDDYAEETSWEFREVGGALIDSGSYNESDDNTTFIETFNVDLDNCYEFELFDSYGDGICCQYGEGEYSLSTSDGEVIFEGAEFTDSELTQMSIGGELSINDASLASISLYPNPATSEITLSIGNTNDSSSYSLYNTFGQLLDQGVVSQNKEVISVSGYTTGIYFIVVKNTVTSIESTLRFIKQ
ncbi:MAG: T9SS type A sorting domain-containing protein, partial [Ulvibacter sp.]|nr:T9SS type A sorting domain-containing protein [Ulvibacter sp.]